MRSAFPPDLTMTKIMGGKRALHRHRRRTLEYFAPTVAFFYLALWSLATMLALMRLAQPQTVTTKKS
jgi:hypothetical protein